MKLNGAQIDSHQVRKVRGSFKAKFTMPWSYVAKLQVMEEGNEDETAVKLI
jgi:hypothetical protein